MFRLVPAGAVIAIALLLSSNAQASPIATPDFDLNPSAINLNASIASPVTVRLSDYGQIIVNPSTAGFSESGYLPFIGFSLNGTAVNLPGFDSGSRLGWGAFIKYSSTGTETITANGIDATYETLSYSLYAYNGVATFGLGATGAAYETGGSNLTLLAKGTLIDGSITITPTGFSGTTATQFAASGKIDTQLNTVPLLYSPLANLDFDIDVDHLPGEVFASSPTTFEADGGTSSTGTFVLRTASPPRRFEAAALDDAPVGTASDPTNVPEPPSFGMLLVSLGALLFVQWQRRRRDVASRLSSATNC